MCRTETKFSKIHLTINDTLPLFICNGDQQSLFLKFRKFLIFTSSHFGLYFKDKCLMVWPKLFVSGWLKSCHRITACVETNLQETAG